jgi:hypothetical protein
MKLKSVIYAFLGIMLLASVAFAIIGGAQVGPEVERGRWTPTANSVDTEGGNVSGVNVSGSVLSSKWASFYGNVTGSIVLTDSAGDNNVYEWAWSPDDGGEVCLSQDSTYDFWGSSEVTGQNVDLAFGFSTSDTDSAANTYNDASCFLTLEVRPGDNVIYTAGTYLSNGGSTGYSTFQNCPIKQTGTPTNETHIAFCTNISASGKNYNNESANYEVMVPTTGTDTYYFFVDLS